MSKQDTGSKKNSLGVESQGLHVSFVSWLFQSLGSPAIVLRAAALELEILSLIFKFL